MTLKRRSGPSIVTGRGATGVEAAVKFGVDGVGLSELIFKDDDAARRIEGGTAVDQFTSPRGDPQLIAGIAAVSALGALGCEKFGLVEASQESWGGSQDLGGATHAVGGVVLVVELIVRVTVGRFVLRVYHNTFRGTLPGKSACDQDDQSAAPGYSGPGHPTFCSS